MNWKDQVVLVTGGTGSFGKKFIKILLEEKQPKKVIIFSRDELKQHEMQVGGYNQENLRYFIGDIRDRERLVRALHGVDIVVHAAALKQVPSCEFHPLEAIRTNSLGAENVLDAAAECGVARVVDQVLGEMLTRSVRLASATAGTIILVDSNGRAQRKIAVRNDKPYEVDELALSRVLEQGLARWVFESGVPAKVDDTHDDPRWLRIDNNGQSSRSAVCVPVWRRRRILAILTLTLSGGGLGANDLTRIARVMPPISRAASRATMRFDCFFTNITPPGRWS